MGDMRKKLSQNASLALPEAPPRQETNHIIERSQSIESSSKEDDSEDDSDEKFAIDLPTKETISIMQKDIIELKGKMNQILEILTK
jgi:hypothetical protein